MCKETPELEVTERNKRPGSPILKSNVELNERLMTDDGTRDKRPMTKDEGRKKFKMINIKFQIKSVVVRPRQQPHDRPTCY